MRFGTVPVDAADGSLLAHGQAIGGRRLSKGHRLTAEDLARARRAGLAHLTVARLDADDLPEDEAAAALAGALRGPHLRRDAPVHGRANLRAAADGLLLLDADAVHALNMVDEALTLATLPHRARVRRGDVVATVKIIPYGVRRAVVARVEALGRAARLSLAPFRPIDADLIHTLLPETNAKATARAGRVTRARIEDLGGRLLLERQCAHDPGALSALLTRDEGTALTLVAGASATVDTGDVVPAAIRMAGGTVDRLGMPVDPGNLICVGHIGARTVIGLPGCGRSPRRNGIDLVLERLFARLPLDSRAIARMGVGGLLNETGERPEPRMSVPSSSGPVQAILLAAGRASRMGANKLAADLNGKAVVAHVADAIAAAGLPPPVVVLGHDSAAVRAALGGRRIEAHEAPAFAEGLSRSLRTGIRALRPEAVAAIVCLGDMPFVPPALLRTMAAAARADSILVPRFEGRQGNPILWGRAYFHRLATLSGDVGAKALLGELADHVHFLDCDDPGVRIDLDTPEDLARHRHRTRGG